MQTDRTLLTAAVFGLAGLAAGCVAPLERTQPAAQIITAESLASTRTFSNALAGAWPAERWWAVFGDKQLDQLIEEALADGPTLRVARARLAQAQAQLDAAFASATPGFGGALDLTRQRFSISGTVPPPVAGTTRTSARLALDFSYEIDYAGRYDAVIAAAQAARSAVGADAQAARLALSSAVARAYFQLQNWYALGAIGARELVQSQRRVELARARVAAGLDTEAVLSRAEVLPAEIRVSLAQLDAAAALARNQLAALLGKGPDRGLAVGAAGAAPLAVLPDLPAKLPIDLLGRRPDLSAARWRAESVSREIDVARMRFLPNVNLLAFAGIASLGLDRLLAAGSAIAGAGPAVRLPLFSAGALQASLRGREADYDLAVEHYNALVIDAVREVADQVQMRRALEAERGERRQVQAATDRTHKLAVQRFQAGIANYLEVLEAEAPLFGLQRADAELSSRALQAEVSLYRALGGGYEDGRSR